MRAPRAVDVGHHPGPRRPVAGAAQPVGHRRQRAVAGEEARDQQHRAAAAVAEAARRARSGRAAARRPRGRIGPPARAAGANSDSVTFMAGPSTYYHGTAGRTCAGRFLARARRDHPGREARRRGAAGPGARRRRDPGAGPGRRSQRRRHAPACAAPTRRRPARRPTSRASSWPARWSRSGPARERFDEGDRVMAVVGGGGQAELAVVHERAAMPVPDGARLAAGGRRARGVHDRPRRDLHPGRAAPRRAPARPRGGRRGGDGRRPARPRRGRARDGDRPARGAARARSSSWARRRSSPRASASTAPSTWSSSSSAPATSHENLKALATGGRIAVIGVGGSGPKAELNLLAVMGKRARIHGSTLRARPLEEKAIAMRDGGAARCCRSSSTARSPCRSPTDLPARRGRAAYERFEAGGKLGKIVLGRL